jgi:thiol-disulfide isomerase/thioredoxin
METFIASITSDGRAENRPPQTLEESDLEVMGEGPEGRSKGGRSGLWLALAAIAVVGLGALALYFSNQGPSKAPLDRPGAGAYARYANGALKGLTVPARPSRLSKLVFNDATGRPVDVGQFRGKVVVVNLWATWCVPCITEMPTLAALQRAYPETVAVVTVSMDTDERLPNARDFIGVHEPLALYHDPRFAIPSSLEVKGMPATLIYDRQGREVGRVMGEAKWDSPEARALIEALLK